MASGPNKGPSIESDIEVQLKKLQLVDVSETGKVIGKGSYGQVIEVYMQGTRCAAKEIHPILITHDDSDRVKRSFQIECVNSSQIFHPNVVQVLGIYYPTPRPKLPWLVMELMETSLKGLIDKYETRGIPLHFKLSILVDVAHGLEFLHAKDIVHRDLSSNNILLTKQLVAKIADLGMAKVIDRNKMKTLTQTPGTLHFMPPEALTNKPRYGPPMDVFSLACVVLHLMSCKWPEPKDRVVEVEDLLIALTEVQRRDEYFQSHFSNVPTLRSLIIACLHNKPEQRPKISEVRKVFQELFKSDIDKQISLATANTIELFEEVCRGHQQKMSIETALKNTESSLAEEKSHVSALENCLAKEKSHVSALENCLAEEKSHVSTLENCLAKEKSHVRTLEATTAAQDQQLQQCHDRHKKLLAQVTQLEEVVKDRNQQLCDVKSQIQNNKEFTSLLQSLLEMVCLKF